MRLAIGLVIANNFPAPTEFWESYEELVWHLASGKINANLPRHLQLEGCRRIKSAKFPTDVARNEICRGFLEGNEDYLLFLDADMTFPVDLVERLVKEEVPVISARYHVKRPPFNANLYVKHRTQDGPHMYASVHYGRGVFEIERCGAGALLIERGVIAAIQMRIGNEWFRYQRGPKEEDHNDFTVSEDFWFCRQVREAGFKIFGHWDVECDHIRSQRVTRDANMAYLTAELNAYERMTPTEQRRLVDSLVVCGMSAGLEIAPGVVVPEYRVTDGER